MVVEGSGELRGKRVLVTAASAGLGFACAAKLAEQGCRVAICARGEDALLRARAALPGPGPHLAVAADLADPADVARLVQEVPDALGGLDILVINSGHVPYGALDTLSDAQWQDAFELLVMSAVRLARGAVARMRAQGGGGDIVFVGSASVRQPSPHLLLSNVLRLGVVGLAKTMASSLAAEGIRVNVVAPGYFDTGRVHARIAAREAEGIAREDAVREVAGPVPMGRIGSAEELAELVAFVVGRRAGFLTGAHIAIDGGATGFPL